MLTLAELITDTRTGPDSGSLHFDGTVASSATDVGFNTDITVSDYTLIANNDQIKLYCSNGTNIDFRILTAKTSGAVAANGEFNIGASNNATATNIAAAINAYAAFLACLTGVPAAAGAVVEITVTVLDHHDSITFTGNVGAITFANTTKASAQRKITALGSAGGYVLIAPPATINTATYTAIGFVAWVLERLFALTQPDPTVIRKSVRLTSTGKLRVTYTVTLESDETDSVDDRVANTDDPFA